MDLQHDPSQLNPPAQALVAEGHKCTMCLSTKATEEFGGPANACAKNALCSNCRRVTRRASNLGLSAADARVAYTNGTLAEMLGISQKELQEEISSGPAALANKPFCRMCRQVRVTREQGNSTYCRDCHIIKGRAAERNFMISQVIEAFRTGKTKELFGKWFQFMMSDTRFDVRNVKLEPAASEEVAAAQEDALPAPAVAPEPLAPEPAATEPAAIEAVATVALAPAPQPETGAVTTRLEDEECADTLRMLAGLCEQPGGPGAGGARPRASASKRSRSPASRAEAAEVLMDASQHARAQAASSARASASPGGGDKRSSARPKPSIITENERQAAIAYVNRLRANSALCYADAFAVQVAGLKTGGGAAVRSAQPASKARGKRAASKSRSAPAAKVAKRDPAAAKAAAAAAAVVITSTSVPSTVPSLVMPPPPAGGDVRGLAPHAAKLERKLGAEAGWESSGALDDAFCFTPGPLSPTPKAAPQAVPHAAPRPAPTAQSVELRTTSVPAPVPCGMPDVLNLPVEFARAANGTAQSWPCHPAGVPLPPCTSYTSQLSCATDGYC